MGDAVALPHGDRRGARPPGAARSRRSRTATPRASRRTSVSRCTARCSRATSSRTSGFRTLRAQGRVELCRLELGGLQPVLEGMRAEVMRKLQRGLRAGACAAADSVTLRRRRPRHDARVARRSPRRRTSSAASSETSLKDVRRSRAAAPSSLSRELRVDSQAKREQLRSGERSTSSSAICTALRAAPLRRLSPATISARPFSTVGSCDPADEHVVDARGLAGSGSRRCARPARRRAAPRACSGASASSVSIHTASRWPTSTGTRTHVACTGSSGSSRILRVSSRIFASSSNSSPSNVQSPRRSWSSTRSAQQPLHRLLAGARDRLVRRDAHAAEARRVVQRLERDHRAGSSSSSAPRSRRCARARGRRSPPARRAARRASSATRTTCRSRRRRHARRAARARSDAVAPIAKKQTSRPPASSASGVASSTRLPSSSCRRSARDAK